MGWGIAHGSCRTEGISTTSTTCLCRRHGMDSSQSCSSRHRMLNKHRPRWGCSSSTPSRLCTAHTHSQSEASHLGSSRIGPGRSNWPREERRRRQCGLVVRKALWARWCGCEEKKGGPFSAHCEECISSRRA